MPRAGSRDMISWVAPACTMSSPASEEQRSLIQFSASVVFAARYSSSNPDTDALRAKNSGKASSSRSTTLSRMMFMLSIDWEMRLSTRVAIWSETSSSQFWVRCSVAFWIAKPFIRNSVPVTRIAMLRPSIVRSMPLRY